MKRPRFASTLSLGVAGLVVLCTAAGLAMHLVHEQRAFTEQTLADARGVAARRAVALAGAQGDPAAVQSLIDRTVDFPRVHEALLWHRDGTLAARSRTIPGAPALASPEFRLPAGGNDLIESISLDPAAARTGRSVNAVARAWSLWQPVGPAGVDGWLQLVVDNDLSPEARRARVIDTLLVAPLLGLLAWMVTSLVLRRTLRVLREAADFAGTLDGAGRQLTIAAPAGELSDLVAALNRASERLAEQRRIAEVNERELRALSGNVPGVIYRCLGDDQWTMEHLSQEFERLTGYPAEDLIGNRVRTYASIIHPADIQKVRSLIDTAIEQRRPFAAEYRLRAADGSTRWVLEKGQAVFNHVGRLVHLTGVIINDTARHSAVTALARSEVKHRQLLENLSDVVWQSDTDARVSFVNRAWKQVSGLPSEALTGRRLFELMLDDDLPVALQAWRRLLGGTDPVVQWQARIITASGENRWGEFTARMTHDPTGEPAGVTGMLKDIHERVLLDNRLREGEERLRESLELSGQLLEAMPHPVYYKDRHGRFRGVNKAWETFHGRLRDSVIGSTSHDIGPPELAAVIEARDRELLEGPDGHQEFETGMTNARGEQRTMRFSKAVLTSYSKERTGIIGVLSDVTESKRTEAELRKLSLVASRTSNPVIITDAQGRIEWVNEAFTTLAGYSLEDAVGQRPGALLQGPETSPETVSFIRTRLTAREGFQAELINYSRMGRRYWVSIDVQPIRNEAGEVIQFIAVESDITERKEREDALHRSEAKARQLAQVVDQASEAIMVKDLDNCFIAWNRGAERLYGYTADEVIGRSAHELIQIDDEGQSQNESLWRLSSARAEHIAIARRKRKDGTLIDVEVSYSPLYDSDGRHVGEIAVARDISERQRYQAELEAAKEAAETANHAKSAFLANMSHEIRTPMNGIIGMTDLALETELNAEQRDWLDTVRRSADNLLQIINDVLDYSKIEAGRIEIETIGFSLRELMSDAVKTLAARAREKSLRLVLDIAPDVPDALDGDPTRIRQVLLNLIGNALKFTERGEVVATVSRVELIGEPAPGAPVGIRFSVRDTGIGIAPDKQVEIFDAFTQGDTSTTRRYGGTGLGLSISRHLVHLLGGELAVTSEHGSGSTFAFTLALTPGGVAGTSCAYERLAGIEPLRALLIDPSPASRDSLVHLLTRWGAAATSCDTLDEARVRAASPDALAASFDLVLVHATAQLDGIADRAEPAAAQEGAGFRLSSLAAWLGARVPLVVITDGGHSRTTESPWRELGASAVLAQPVTASDLYNAIGDRLVAPDTPASIDAPNGAHMGSVSGPASKPAGDRPASRPLSVLLAEDNAVNRQLAVTLLQRAGHRVEVACDGEEAVAAWRPGHFDVILMDVQMPRLGGFEATARIRAMEQTFNATAGTQTPVHTPIVALTAHAMVGDAERCIEAGMDAYLSKPLRRERLMAVLAEAAGPAASDQAASAAAPAGSPAGVPAVDMRALNETLGGDRELLQTLSEMFLESLPAMLARLSKAVSAGEVAEVEAAAHALRGSIANFHARPAMAALMSLERSASERQTGSLATAFAQVTREVERAAQALTEALREAA